MFQRICHTHFTYSSASTDQVNHSLQQIAFIQQFGFYKLIKDGNLPSTHLFWSRRNERQLLLLFLFFLIWLLGWRVCIEWADEYRKLFLKRIWIIQRRERKPLLGGDLRQSIRGLFQHPRRITSTRSCQFLPKCKRVSARTNSVARFGAEGMCRSYCSSLTSPSLFLINFLSILTNQSWSPSVFGKKFIDAI